MLFKMPSRIPFSRRMVERLMEAHRSSKSARGRGWWNCRSARERDLCGVMTWAAAAERKAGRSEQTTRVGANLMVDRNV